MSVESLESLLFVCRMRNFTMAWCKLENLAEASGNINIVSHFSLMWDEAFFPHFHTSSLIPTQPWWWYKDTPSEYVQVLSLKVSQYDYLSVVSSESAGRVFETSLIGRIEAALNLSINQSRTTRQETNYESTWLDHRIEMRSISTPHREVSMSTVLTAYKRGWVPPHDKMIVRYPVLSFSHSFIVIAEAHPTWGSPLLHIPLRCAYYYSLFFNPLLGLRLIQRPCHEISNLLVTVRNRQSHVLKERSSICQNITNQRRKTRCKRNPRSTQNITSIMSQMDTERRRNPYQHLRQPEYHRL